MARKLTRATDVDPEIDEHVRSDCFKLRDRVDEEIDRRARLGRDDAPTRFLEVVRNQYMDRLTGRPSEERR